MADNYVQIRIKATDTAKPDLTSLKADLDDLGNKVDTAKVDVDDTDAKRKLLEINAELARLNKRMASGRLDVAGAAKVESDLAKVSDKLDELREKADKAKDHAVEDLDSVREHVSKLHEVVSKVAEGGGLFAKLLYGGVGKIGGAGDAESGPMGFLKILGSLSGSALGGGGIAFGIGAILTEVDGLVSGFAAAGIGAGAFAALAVPAFDKVKTAYSGIASAQAAYHKAQLTESMDPTKANASAVAKSLLNLKEAWHGLDPAERGAVHGLQDFSDTWQKMVKAFEPTAFKVFNDGLKIANELLPAVTPFAKTFGNAIDGLLKQAAGFFKITEPLTSAARGMGLVGDSSRTALTPFGQWLKQFHSLEGPSITAIGHGLGQVGIAIGKLLTIMSRKDVVNSINIAFTVLADTINALGFTIRRIMLRWSQWKQWADQITHAFDTVRHGAADLAHNIAAHFDEIRHDVADLGHNVAAHFDEIRHEAANLAHNLASYFDEIRSNLARWATDVGHDAERVVDFFRSLPGRVMSALSALPGELFSFGAHIIEQLASGILSAIGSVTSAIGSIAGDILDHIPHSPAKKGPLSGSGDPRLGGKRIAQMLAEGLTDGVSGVSRAADRVAGAAVMGGHGGHGGGTLKIELQWVGGQSDSQFMTWLQRNIRARGGSPGIIQNKVVFQ